MPPLANVVGLSRGYLAVKTSIDGQDYTGEVARQQEQRLCTPGTPESRF